jgi:hypothetical protein
MLQDAPHSGFGHIVSWVNDGDSFKVHNTKEFVQYVMPQYFDQTKYESFRRQLNLYGFTRIVRGQHRGVYSHPLFRRDHKDWCRYISRQQQQQQHQQQQQQQRKNIENLANNNNNDDEDDHDDDGESTSDPEGNIGREAVAV